MNGRRQRPYFKECVLHCSYCVLVYGPHDESLLLVVPLPSIYSDTSNHDQFAQCKMLATVSWRIFISSSSSWRGTE